MQSAFLEHANLTVSNPDQTASLFSRLFDWEIRWSGIAKDSGYTVHVGNENSYLAIYMHPMTKRNDSKNHQFLHNLNHLGIVVDDIESTEKRVRDEGLATFDHATRNPGGHCFYFRDNDGLEIEVVSYQTTAYYRNMPLGYK